MNFFKLKGHLPRWVIPTIWCMLLFSECYFIYTYALSGFRFDARPRWMTIKEAIPVIAGLSVMFLPRLAHLGFFGVLLFAAQRYLIPNEETREIRD